MNWSAARKLFFGPAHLVAAVPKWNQQPPSSLPAARRRPNGTRNPLFCTAVLLWRYVSAPQRRSAGSSSFIPKQKSQTNSFAMPPCLPYGGIRVMFQSSLRMAHLDLNGVMPRPTRSVRSEWTFLLEDRRLAAGTRLWLVYERMWRRRGLRVTPFWGETYFTASSSSSSPPPPNKCCGSQETDEL